MIRKIIFCICSFMALLAPFCLAKASIEGTLDKEVIQKQEEVALKLNLKDVSIAAFTIEVYWDREKLEYVKGPEGASKTDSRVIYTWVSETGQNKQNIALEDFVFKGMQDGLVNIVVTGEFYRENGEEVFLEDGMFRIQVGESQEDLNEIDIVEPLPEIENVAENSANLRIMRVGKEGISPEFSPEIQQYYLVVGNDTSSLSVTAVPENKGATVTVTGNDHLKMGQNEIQIKVVSKDKTQEKTYKINVTRTANVDLANSNLETLAIKEGTLTPEFDARVTNYAVEVANDVTRLEVLAIPQKENAKVTISGNEEILEGENQVVIRVLAEDGMTEKEYHIRVYRRNKEEEMAYQEEEKVEAERLSAILEANDKVDTAEAEQKNQYSEETKRNITISMVALIIIIFGIFGGIYLGYYRRKKK